MKLWKNKIPDPNEFFKPLYNIYGGNFKVREKKRKEYNSLVTLSAIYVISKLARQMLPEGGIFSTAGSPKGPPGPWDFPLLCRCLHRQPWLTVKGLCCFSTVQCAVGRFQLETTQPVPPQWKLPLRASSEDLSCVIFSGWKKKRLVSGRLFSEISHNFSIHVFFHSLYVCISMILSVFHTDTQAN